MPAKYSHVKKRSASGLLKKEKNSPNGHHIIKDIHQPRAPNPHVDRNITQALSAVSQLERTISRILLLRYEQDIARLYSTRLYSIALVHLPTLVMRCVTLGGPGWLAYNHDSEEIKDFFRAAISMDMRQAGERVATKSVLWSYTALRHFVRANCRYMRGLLNINRSGLVQQCNCLQQTWIALSSPSAILPCS